MKLTKIIKTGGAIMAGLIAFSACQKKEGKEVAFEQNDFTTKSVLQVINASIPNAATDPRRVYVYVDSRPVNGAALAFASMFPSSGSGFAVTAGYSTFLVRDTATTATQPQISFAENFQAGKAYTIFLYDTFTAVKQKTVQTDIVIPSDTTARLRFANFVYHPTQIPGIDIFSKKRNQFVATNLQVTQVTDYMPYASSLADSFIVSENGNPSNLLDTLVFNPTRKRSYTLVFMGRWRTNEMAISSTATAPNPRRLAVFANN